MKLQVTKGRTSKLLDIFVRDASSGAGAGLTGLVFNSAGLTAYYYREGAATATAITLATMTVGTWATGGFKEIDATNLPGWYQLGIPDAALATGADSVAVHLKGATNMVPLPIEVQLQNLDPYDGVRGGMTALPNAAAGATGGLDPAVIFGGTASAGAATSITLAGAAATDNIYNHMLVRITGGTGAGQARVIVSYVGSTKVATVGRNWTVTPDNTSVFVVTGPETMLSWNLFQGLASAGGATSVTLTGGAATSSIYNGSLVCIVAGTGARQARVATAYNGGTGVVTVDRTWQTNPDSTSVILILAADLPGADGTGNLSGSIASVVGAVGSVTGAVGSVTGNVGGNVVGSVASVTADVGITQTGADKVWGTAARTLTAFTFAVDLSAAAVTLIWDKATSALTTAGSIGKLLVDNINATISSRLAAASISLSGGAVTVGTNNDKTGYGLAANAVDAAQFTQAAADKVWTSTTRTLSAFSTALAQSVWDVLASAVAVASSIGLQLKTNVDATISSRASAASLTTLQADTDDIQTRLPAALVSGRIDASVGAMATDTLTAGALATSAVTEIQTAIAAGSVAAVVGAVGSVTGNVGGSLGSLGATAKTDVKTQITDALAVDTYAEAGAVPAATSTLKDKINWLFLLARNKITQTATTEVVRNDGDTVSVGTNTVSDSAGTFTRGKWS